jgi:hypothetical protein
MPVPVAHMFTVFHGPLLSSRNKKTVSHKDKSWPFPSANLVGTISLRMFVFIIQYNYLSVLQPLAVNLEE